MERAYYILRGLAKHLWKKVSGRSWKLCVNDVAGTYYIVKPKFGETIRSHYNLHSEYPSRIAAEAEVEKIKKDTSCFVLHVNNTEGVGIITEENDFSGNWRGSKYGSRYMYSGEFTTYGQALDSLEGMGLNLRTNF